MKKSPFNWKKPSFAQLDLWPTRYKWPAPSPPGKDAQQWTQRCDDVLEKWRKQKQESSEDV